MTNDAVAAENGASAAVPIAWVDAFCDGPFTGNPAAVCVLDEPAPAAGMQALAAELGLSETAFVWPQGPGYSLRWFTPCSEVDLCGHATVAAAAVLARRSGVTHAEWAFTTRSGVLLATVEDAMVTLDLPADDPVPVEVPPVLARCWPVVRAAAGAADLVVEVPDVDAVRAAVAPLAEIAALPYRGVILTAAARGAAADAHRGVVDPPSTAELPTGTDYVLRFFAPRVGVPEDPVTGSAQCALGPYWAKLLGADALWAAQLSERGGRLWVHTRGDRVEVRGSALVVLEGAVTTAVARLVRGDTG